MKNKEKNSFLEVLKSGKKTKVYPEADRSEVLVDVLSEARRSEPEEMLRNAGFKIKLVTPTSFGTQIDFAKKYDPEEIEDLLKDFNVKIKDKSVFIIE